MFFAHLFSRLRRRPLVAGATTALLGLLLWANWALPALHAFAPAVEFATFQVDARATPALGSRLQRVAAGLPGVTAAALNPRAHCLTVAWQPARIGGAAVYERLRAVGHGRVWALPAATLSAAEAARQCPVPAGYVQALERLRFTLNLRRFFVAA